MRDAAMDPQARLLASLPLRLIPGGTGASSLSGFSFMASPIKLALVISWLCMLLAAVAVGVLLHGATSLSERRGAFVSAVTHELRTPLTTFKMYSEMLAEGWSGRGPETAVSQHALFGSESPRASAWRMSWPMRGLSAAAPAAVSRASRWAQLIERVKPRLVQRADQAEHAMQVDGSRKRVAIRRARGCRGSGTNPFQSRRQRVQVRGAATRRRKIIHLEALPDGRFAMLRVRDHGQGISEEGARRLFQPFSKSAHEAAHTAPGVGLGLALCRRLSRSMGGDLRLDGLVKNGACFVLSLPLSNGARPATIA